MTMTIHKTKLQDLIKSVVENIVKHDVIICKFYGNTKDFAMLVYNNFDRNYHWIRLEHPLYERSSVDGVFKNKEEGVLEAIKRDCEIHTFESMDQVFKWSALKDESQ
jgi:hypothetical protein